MPWTPLSRIAFAVCIYPFHPTSTADLPLQLGDELYIIEQGGKDFSWYRGYLVAPPSLLAGLTSTRGQPLEARVFSGIFPRECVEVREILGGVLPHAQGAVNGQETGQPVHRRSNHKPPAPVPMLKIGDETPLSRHEPLVDEISSCLREWHSTNLHELLLSRQYDVVDEVAGLIDRLDNARRQLLHNVLTRQEAQTLRQQAVWDLVRGNKLFNGEVVVRKAEDKGCVLTAEDSAIDLSRLQADMSLLEHAPIQTEESKVGRHLLVSLDGDIVAEGEASSMTLSIHRHTKDIPVEQVSEAFAVDVSRHNQQSTHRARKSALFADLDLGGGQEHVSDTVAYYLIIRLFSNESPRGAAASSGGSELPSSEDANSPISLSTQPNSKLGRKSFMWPGRRRDSETMDRLSRHMTSSQDLLNTAQPDASATPERKTLKRLAGVGVFELSKLLAVNSELQTEVPILRTNNSSEDLIDANEALLDVIQQMQPSVSGRYSLAMISIPVKLNLNLFSHESSEKLVADHPTLLANAFDVPMIEPSRTLAKPRNDIYLTITRPDLPPNVMLSHPKLGSCPLPEDLVMRDLQLTFEVRNAAGNRIEGCIFPTCNSSGHTAWRTIAIERGESWNQTVKLSIRPEDVPGAHIVASLADASNFPFALCWMPLWEHDAFSYDGTHSLALYKYDEQTSNIISGRGAYLSLPWSTKSKGDALLGPIATLQIRTKLCSTTFSSDSALLGLLMWREQRSRDIIPILRKAQTVPDTELVKLSRRTFDAIFEIMTEYGGNEEVEDLTFDLLVTLLSLVHDRRFSLQPMIDEYAKTNYRYPFAFPALTRSFVRLLSRALNNESAKRLRSAAKIGNLLLRFIILARQQQIQKEAGIGIKSHRPSARDLQNIFIALNSLMENTAPVLVGTKTMLVQNFDSWLTELRTVFGEEELFSVSSKFIDASSHSGGKLVFHRLVLINFICAADLFQSDEVRVEWQKKTVHWLTPYWGTPHGAIDQWRDQIRLCSAVVATQVKQWHTSLAPWLRKLIDSYMALQSLPKAATELGTYSSLFPDAYPPSSRRVAHEPTYDEGLIEIAGLLATRNGSSDYLPFLSEPDLFDLLVDLFAVYNSILDHQAFPSTWLSLDVYHHRAMLENLQKVHQSLVGTFLPDPENASEFATDLWHLFFSTLIKIVGSKVLAVETFPEQKRRAIWKIAADVRQYGAELLDTAWEALGWNAEPEDQELYGLSKLGGYQVQYVPSLVGPIIVLCLGVHEGLRRAATNILRTMIVSEWTLNEDLVVLQGEILNRLDTMFRTEPINDAVLQKLFIAELLESFDITTTDLALRAAVKSLVDVIDHLLDLLGVVYNTPGSGEASQIMNTLRLMDFLRDMQKETVYIAYVHRLADTQSKAGNHAEAGLALRLHAELYDWNTSTSVAAVDEPRLPMQKSFERKEWIYFQMIRHFEEGSSWHHALAAYEELAREYETTSFDFAKLARARRASAAIYEKIAAGEKHTARYFRVVYRGLGFPATLRDKHFIFEGLPSDHTATFADRLQKQFPLAHVISGKEVIDDVEGQYLSIIPVQAQKDLTHPVNRRPKVNTHIREHFMLGHPRTFTITPRMRQNEGDTSKEPAIEKVVFTTAEAFPTILRRSEIVKTETMRLSPTQAALERTMRKTQELAALEASVKASSTSDRKAFKRLTEAIGILVRLDSGGCVSEYWSMVLSRPLDEIQDFANNLEDANGGQSQEDQKQLKLADALRVALIDHTLAIRRNLALCNARSGLSAASDELAKAFQESFAPILATLDPPRPQSMMFDAGPPIPLPLSPSAPPSPTKPHATPSILLPHNGTDAGLKSTPMMTPLSPTQSIPFSSLDLAVNDTTKSPKIEAPGVSRWPSRLSTLSIFSGSTKGKEKKLSTGGGTEDGVGGVAASSRPSVEEAAAGSSRVASGGGVSGNSAPGGLAVPRSDKRGSSSQDSASRLSKRLSFLGLGNR